MSKFLVTNTDGFPKEESSLSTSAGAGDSGKIPNLDAGGRLDTSFMPVGIGADTKTITASENLSAGDLINVWDSTGVKVRKADASGGIAKKCDGFVLTSVLSGAVATVYFEGIITGLSGLTVGGNYFLSGTVAGASTLTIDSTATHISQYVGKAVSTTEITFEPATPIIRV